jgi:hypothetical protein
MSTADPTDLMAGPSAPFPGLRPFEPHEWPIFCGRERTTLDVISRLGERNVVLVHGGSGCGKSSLVRAGVIPTIDRDHRLAGRHFVHAIMRPSEGPLTALGRLLTDKLGPIDGGWAHALIFPNAIVERIDAACAAAKTDTFCLLIDQFEEVFRWARECGREDVQLLTDVLAKVSEGTACRFFVMLTMRSDYLGDCAQFGGLSTVINDCQFFLPNLDDRGLLRSIVDPPKLFGGSIDQVLANKLRFAASAERDPLPTLQHLLMRMAERKRAGGNPWVLTIDDFDYARRGSGALSAHADALFAAASGGDAATEADMGWFFRSLIDRDVGGRGIRRPCSVADLAAISGLSDEALDRVVSLFSAEGANLLVVSDPGPGPEDRRIDISHEALIRNWRRMTEGDGVPGWLQQELDDALIWQTLAISARTPGALLDGATLVEREAWFANMAQRPARARRYMILRGEALAPADEPEWQSVVALLKRSRDAVEKEAAEHAVREAATQAMIDRRANRISWFLRLASAVVVAGIFWILWQTIQTQGRSFKNENDKQSKRLEDVVNLAIEGGISTDLRSDPASETKRDTVTDATLESIAPVIKIATSRDKTAGYMWIGSATDLYIRPPGKAGPFTVNEVMPEATYETLDNIVLRNGPPRPGNQLQSAINVIPKGSTVTVDTAPTRSLGRSGAQYWISVRDIQPSGEPLLSAASVAVGSRQPQVFPHFVEASEEKIAFISGELRKKGFRVMGSQILGQANGTREVRFCNEADSILAEKLTIAIGNILPSHVPVKATQMHIKECNTVKPGVLELWIERP